MTADRPERAPEGLSAEEIEALDAALCDCGRTLLHSIPDFDRPLIAAVERIIAARATTSNEPVTPLEANGHLPSALAGETEGGADLLPSDPVALRGEEFGAKRAFEVGEGGVEVLDSGKGVGLVPKVGQAVDDKRGAEAGCAGGLAHAVNHTFTRAACQRFVSRRRKRLEAEERTTITEIIEEYAERVRTGEVIPPPEYRRRCLALRDRGLGKPVLHKLWYAHSAALLREVEALSDEQIHLLSEAASAYTDHPDFREEWR